MTLDRPEFRPDPDLSHEEMEALQRDIADAAEFEDDLPFDPEAVALNSPVEADASGNERLGASSDAPVVVGVDQAFLEERAVSAIVAIQDGAVVERVHSVTPLSIPYIPGLLAFREGGPILAAFEELSVEPDLAIFDGSGRIHFRQAGIATHIGVMLDLPSIGVAKRLLCGEPAEPVADRPAGWSTPILADASVVDRRETTEKRAGSETTREQGVEAPEGTVIGHAYQSRQWDREQSINPLYISPGHRVSASTTVDLVDSLCAGYKLPEPTRLADRHADDAKAQYE
ncbi:deoxyribonuclease V [Halolamina salifodinae]|uniref:Endonuclease V n=2 Tax=Halolamina salifodinae TaxID=1202767 RepID=A0A8T4GSF0_9EURY|nr:endonuclease V [Halolamina salifodinae]MBP1985786.1 deoxyribonuclease V [Halolamina salifodinae]